MRLTLDRRPANEGIPSPRLPRRRAKQHTGQIPPPPVPHQILDVLPDGAGVAQIMIPMQQPVKDRPRFGLPAQLLDLQRLQFAQGAHDRIGRVRQTPDWFVAHAVGRKATARGQRHPAPLLQLEQQRARGHVLDLAVETAPVPSQAQLAREPIPAPIRMARQQGPHLFQLDRANLPPLNDQTLIHALTLHRPPSRVQPKMKLFFACFSLPPSPRAPYTACQLNEKT